MNEQHIKQLKKVMEVLKVTDYSILFGRTNHGDLCYKIPKEGEPHFTLDAVPVTKEVETELNRLLLQP